jgi:hypothetical protein
MIVIETKQINKIIPNCLVFLIIVKINPMTIRFIVSENVVIIIINRSLCSFLDIVLKKSETMLSKPFVELVIVNTDIIAKQNKNTKMCDFFISQKGL